MLLKINHNMELKFLHKNEWIPVDLKPCFPNSYENDFFSIRNRDGEEVYLIENILNIDFELEHKSKLPNAFFSCSN